MIPKILPAKDPGGSLKITASKPTFSILAALSVLFICVTAIFQSAFAADALINCNAHEGACTQSLGTVNVSLEITPQPVKAMQDLRFKVSISGPPLSKNPYMLY